MDRGRIGGGKGDFKTLEIARSPISRDMLNRMRVTKLAQLRRQCRADDSYPRVGRQQRDGPAFGYFSAPDYDASTAGRIEEYGQESHRTLNAITRGARSTGPACGVNSGQGSRCLDWFGFQL